MSVWLADEWTQVQPNLVASGICFIIAGGYARWKIKGLHKSLDGLHAHLRRQDQRDHPNA